jgi:hypothetical protein
MFGIVIRPLDNEYTDRFASETNSVTCMSGFRIRLASGSARRDWAGAE